MGFLNGWFVDQIIDPKMCNQTSLELILNKGELSIYKIEGGKKSNNLDEELIILNCLIFEWSLVFGLVIV